jgi:hypothetical protein
MLKRALLLLGLVAAFALPSSFLRAQRLSGAPGAVATGGVTWRSLAATMTQVGRATNVAQLEAMKVADYAKGVLRTNVNGAAPVLYASLGAACDLGAGAGDGGFEVPSADGGCWRAVIGPEGADLRLWGAIGASDDEPTLALANTAMGSTNWDGPKTLRIPGTVNLTAQWAFGNVEAIVGAGQSRSGFAGSGAIGAALSYAGAGPLVLRDFFISQAIYNSSMAPNAGDSLDIGSSTGPLGNVELRNVTITGGLNGIKLFDATRVVMRNLFIDRAYGYGLDLIGAQTGATLKLQTIDIDIRCRAVGEECVVGPTQGATTTAPRAIRIRGSADGSTSISTSQACFAIAGSPMSEVDVDVSGQNCLGGFLNLKRDNAVSGVTTIIPNRNSDITGRAHYSSQIDAGFCLGITNNNVLGDTASDLMRNIVEKGTCSYAPPGLWQASMTYHPGDVVMNSGCGSSSGYCTYMEMANTGVSAGSGGPTGRTMGAAIADGALSWLYMKDVSGTVSCSSGQCTDVPQNIIGADLFGPITDAFVDLSAENLAIGVKLAAGYATTDDTMRRLTITARGTVRGAGFTDSAGNQTVTADHLTLLDWNLYSLGDGSSNGCLQMGSASGTYLFDYTNLVLQNVLCRDDGAAGLYHFATASTIQGKIVGGDLGGKKSAIELEGTGAVTLTAAGDPAFDTIATSSNQPVIYAAAGATGSLEIDGDAAVKSAAAVGSAGFEGWTNNGGSFVVSGRLIRGTASASPASTACNYADLFLKTQPTGAGNMGWACSTPSATAGTWTAF